MNEKIYYNEDFPEGVEPLYNGNIADDYYSAHDSAHFRLSYDGLNRLTASQQYTRDGVKTAAAEALHCMTFTHTMKSTMRKTAGITQTETTTDIAGTVAQRVRQMIQM